MTKADPLSTARRERLQAYCRRKGWQNENGTWAIKVIGQHLKKPPQKVSDLLNGRGAFGAKIARDIEESSGDLPPGYLDALVDLGDASTSTAVDGRAHVGAASGPSFSVRDTGPVERDTSYAVPDVVRLLGTLLTTVSDDRRAEVVELVRTFAVAPDSARIAARLTELLSDGLPSPTWRDAAIHVATEFEVRGESIDPGTLIGLVDAVYSDHISQLRAASARPTVIKA